MKFVLYVHCREKWKEIVMRDVESLVEHWITYNLRFLCLTCDQRTYRMVWIEMWKRRMYLIRDSKYEEALEGNKLHVDKHEKKVL